MKLKKMLGGLVLAMLASGCGPRLKPAADAAEASGEAPEAPLAKMSVQHDAAKLDATTHKYTQDGQFKVSGLFYDAAGEPREATVNVAVQNASGAVSRAYALDLTDLVGTQAKVEMWDDGFLTVVIPPGETPTPGFQTSNTNIRAAALEVPGQGPSTCYFGKEVLDGDLRFALCDLQTETPRLAFVDSTPKMAASAGPVEQPAAGAEPAPAAEPAAPAN